MDKLEPPGVLSLTGNVAENWKKFKQRFDVYMTATGAAEKGDKQKACIFLHVVGEEAVQVYNTFVFDDGDEYKLKKILEKFEAYCTPKRNTTYERHKFFTRVQRSDETIDQYVTELRTMAKNCEFGDLVDSLIRDRIICGVPDNALKERLLRTVDLTLDKALATCRAAESTKEQIKSIVPSSEVHAVGTKPKDKKVWVPKKGKSGAQLCGRCGYDDSHKTCPAMGQICIKCNGANHFAKVCKSKGKQNSMKKKMLKKKHIHDIQDEQAFFIDALDTVHSDKPEEWRVTLCTNGKGINYKLDTGSQVNILLEKQYYSLRWKPKLHQTNIQLMSYSKHSIPVLGACVLEVTHLGKAAKVYFVIVQDASTAILGVKACDKLGLVKRTYTIENCTKIKDTTAQIVDQNNDLFDGLGCLPGEHKISIDPAVTPVVSPCRKIPFALHEKLQDELKRMENMGVICKETEHTDWVSPIVIVPKKDGKIRVCLDPIQLNKAIQREHYQLPTRDEIHAKFKDAHYFSKLDARTGFWQMKLDQNSSKLTCFNTPFGRYRFLRLPFGITSAPEIYHRTIHMIYEHIPGCTTMMDDIIVWGSTLQEHNQRLQQVFDASRKSNLKLNREKCVFGVKELTFVGDTISAEGIKPDEAKVKAITNFETPKSKKDVQRFLGMLNYQARYVPDLSSKTQVLRNLTEEKNQFQWTAVEQKSFEELKAILTSTPVLKFFDPNKEIKISSDASSFGLGAVLLQRHDNEWMPVAYASRVMSDAETRYAQIEKEMLAISFACEHFHQYIFGQVVEVETDHKPLVSIFKKSLNDCPLRLQRLLLRVQKYDLRIGYTPGKFMHTADALSRGTDMSTKLTKSAQEEDLKVYVDSVIKSLPISDRKLQMIREETQNDPKLQLLAEVIVTGFPETRTECPKEISEYWNIRTELSLCDGIIMKTDRIVIPVTLRKEMLTKIHTGHLGIEKCRNRAKQVMYWPGMYAQIEEMVNSCSTCIKFRPKQPSEPLKPHDLCNYPWEKVGADLCVFNGENYLVLCDYYSNYPEVCRLHNVSSQSVINAMKYVFSGQGIPKIVFSDNGPQFKSAEFSEFAKSYDFQHHTSSPLYPKSNGLVEKTVGIVKGLLKKSADDGSDFHMSLLIYRATPILDGKSPAEILNNGRKLRSNLPMADSCRGNHLTESYERAKIQQKLKQKQYHDRNTKELSPLSPGQTVRLRDHNDSNWGNCGKVLDQVAPRSYLVQTENGHMYRRNRRHILQSNKQFVPYEQYDCQNNDNVYHSSHNPCDDGNTPSLSHDMSISTNHVPTQNVSGTTRSGRSVKKPQRLIEEI